MIRDEAYSLLTKYMQNKNLLKHCVACEAAMKGIYKHLTPTEKQNDEEKEIWGITGLLHDIDYEVAQKENKLDRHGILFFEDPKYQEVKETIPEIIAHAIKAHNVDATKVEPASQMDWAIACVDALTGLIVACALIKPEKSLDAIDADFIMKRFGEKSFAKGARREAIKQCEESLQIPLLDFIRITLMAMQKEHVALGL